MKTDTYIRPFPNSGRTPRFVLQMIASTMLLLLLFLRLTFDCTAQNILPAPETAAYSFAYSNSRDIDINYPNLYNIYVREIAGKIYFNLMVKSDSTEGIFVLTRVSDEEGGNVVEVRKNVPTSIASPILYSFLEESPPQVKTTYKLVKYTKNTTYNIDEYTYLPEVQQSVLVEHPDE